MFGEGWYWDTCKVANENTNWQTTKVGKHVPNQFNDDYYKIYKEFCTFAHKDLSFYLAGGHQVSSNEDASEFTIHWPTVDDEEFSYDGITPKVETNVIDKDNWLPGVVMSIPFTHIEIPYSIEEKDEDKVQSIVDNGTEVYVTPY